MPTKYNLDIIRGSRYLKGFIYQNTSRTPINLTGLEARMHIRRRKTSSSPEMELTTTNGKITLGGSAGTINIVLTAIDTDTLTIDTGVYDLELYDPLDTDVVDTILEGAVIIRDAITR